jgi:glycerol uptake facilitator-like aquaporin
MLVCAVVGSGIAAQRLSPGDAGLQLLENALATGAALAVLIVVLQPVSAAFNPLVTILERGRTRHIPWAVGAYITAAYWFTSSTSFANPAVTVARMFSDTFAGIAPASVPAFVAAQAVGAGLGYLIARAIYPPQKEQP